MIKQLISIFQCFYLKEKSRHQDVIIILHVTLCFCPSKAKAMLAEESATHF